MHEPIDVDTNAAKTVATISIATEGDGTDSPSNAALAALRDDIIPATVGALPDDEVAVTGMTAYTRDFKDQMKTVAPLVFGFVLLFAFGLMLVSFRSFVIAVKAVVLNLLSVAAAYGILVLVFQHGWGKRLLGFEFTGGIDPFLPILLFVILFGLSMDYHVFILSRIREAYAKGMTTEEAIAHGIKTSAGVVTSAAIVMVGVFAIFATCGDDPEAVRGRTGRGHPDRRHDRPGRAPTGDDEAARRLELVPAQVAELASASRARAARSRRSRPQPVPTPAA